MGFVVSLVLTYATSLAVLVAYSRYQFGLSMAAVLVWIVLMVGMIVLFRRKALWAAPSALAALFPPAAFGTLIAVCATGSTGCM